MPYRKSRWTSDSHRKEEEDDDDDIDRSLPALTTVFRISLGSPISNFGGIVPFLFPSYVN